MMKKLGILGVVIVFILSSAVAFAGESYTLGVLAKRGPVKALKKWSATGDYLSSAIGQKFEIVPLSFDEVNPAIKAGKLDFFLVNSSMFVTAKVKYGAKAIATMVNSRQGKALKSFGGVIFTSVDNDAINTLADLKGQSFMGVKKSSFGGWQMAYSAFINAGIDPFADFSDLKFGNKHDNVVLAVQNGVVAAGTVRTDTLERMAADETIYMEDFKIIKGENSPEFPFVLSTALYPEWPLAKAKKTPEAIANQVVAVLKNMTPGDAAAKSAKIVGWVDALDYTPVENLQKKLKIGAFK
ncbi:MAG: phosphate/phosphite/phosphonate ABC transporter substrate-binding protein [Desulfobacterium sp.]|nr:phosphate/phosphite/phosphonate ABC transporter substrate-binding protein [Desulfobacterium sp.]